MRNVLIFLIAITLVKPKPKMRLAGSYISWFASSQFTYKFKKNGTYSFSGTGHIGDFVINGEYFLFKDTVYLKPFQKRNKYLWHNDTLLLSRATCLKCISISEAAGYDFCKQ